MILAAGLFTESMGFDITIICTVLVMFATVIGLLISAKREKKTSDQERKKEIHDVVKAAINASPEKVVVAPQPLMIAIQEQYVSKNEIKDVLRRIEILEKNGREDKETMLTLIADVPLRTAEMLAKIKGL
jgi:hypothetical protein